MPRKSGAYFVREALAQGIVDPEEIKKYVRKHGYKISDAAISIIKNGKKPGHISIPYMPFEKRHRKNISRMMDRLREWINNDDLFIDILLEESRRIAKLAYPDSSASRNGEKS